MAKWWLQGDAIRPAIESEARRANGEYARLYIFQWTGGHANKERFDAGLTNAAGKPRPAYCVVYKQLRHTKRCPYRTVSN